MFHNNLAMRNRARHKVRTATPSGEPRLYHGEGYIGNKLVQRDIMACSDSEAQTKALRIFNSLMDVFVTPASVAKTG